jgi:integrase
MVTEMTAQSVKALPPGDKRYIVRDANVSGLELRVAPDGTKTWSLRYRNLEKQQRRLKLGEYPRMGLADARKQANRELRKVDGGIDPQAERQAARVALELEKRARELAKRDTIQALCDGYIERHAKVKKRTWRDDQSMLRNEILPVWKGRTISSITRRDCRELVQAIADRPAPIYANRIVSLLSRMFRFAVAQEFVDANPAAHLEKPGTEASERTNREVPAYSHDEIRTIWTATEELPAPLRAIYRLGLVTGQRPGEISDMEWEELDGSWWSIPARRMKAGRDHRVFLTKLALDELARVIRIEGERHVFCGYRGERQQSEWNAKVFVNIRHREKPRHALRHTVITGLSAAGVNSEDVSKVASHTFGQRTTMGYNAYDFDKEKRVALQKWERRLRAILEEKNTSKKVVSIAKRA